MLIELAHKMSISDEVTIKSAYLKDLGAELYDIFIQPEADQPMIVAKTPTREAVIMPQLMR